MEKKYTVMFFSDKLGAVRTITIDVSKVIYAAVAMLIVFGLSAAVGYNTILNNKSYEKKELAAIETRNIALESKLVQYTTQMDSIIAKLTTIDEFEYQIRDIVALQKGDTPFKPVAVGGKEVDVLKDYISGNKLGDMDVLDTLESAISIIDSEVGQRELRISELASTMESKKIVMLNTPTIWPVDGWINSSFGYRISPITNKRSFHEGVDIAARYGSDVKAAAQGSVVFVGAKPGYNSLVIIDHGYGYVTRYGYVTDMTVKVGAKVEKGEVIGKVDESAQGNGTHLHYELLVNGIPVDPSKFVVSEKTS